MIEYLEALPGVLWPSIFLLVYVANARSFNKILVNLAKRMKALSGMKTPFGELEFFKQVIDVAAADNEFQVNEIKIMLDRAEVYGKTREDVAVSILKYADEKKVNINDEGRMLLDLAIESPG